MIMIWSHVCYLTFSILITVLVGRTLHKHGRLFLIDIFAGNISTADAVNHLLLVGYYLTNIALVSLGIRYGGEADTPQSFVELLSYKVGWVMVILGGMHFFNLIVLFSIRWPDKATATLESLACGVETPANCRPQGS
ncbi:hypothetical protein CA54_39820 [Symmachiella macrocystis]|uniref:Uncharacterized protein n=1 Tax=Symmachiella macrocystis TaxID=2527985 RepID=A0A5C6B8Z2_9PLAN|nr:hypothetical protein [Symmachiella macrocystis]TWU08745.1 hypothetical protein CA54_39820 [Symmachiella macrocystis]